MVPGIVFEKFGFRYFGPIDGHDVKSLVKTLKQYQKSSRPEIPAYHHIQRAKAINLPRTIRFVSTAFRNSIRSPANRLSLSKSLPYTKVFGETVAHLASKIHVVCAITAAMCSGTGPRKIRPGIPGTLLRCRNRGTAWRDFRRRAGGVGIKPVLRRLFDFPPTRL